jgi:hypothetical protein
MKADISTLLKSYPSVASQPQAANIGLICFYGVQVSRTMSSFVTIKPFWGDVSPDLSLSLFDFWGMVPLTVTQ